MLLKILNRDYKAPFVDVAMLQKHLFINKSIVKENSFLRTEYFPNQLNYMIKNMCCDTDRGWHERKVKQSVRVFEALQKSTQI